LPFGRNLTVVPNATLEAGPWSSSAGAFAQKMAAAMSSAPRIEFRIASPDDVYEANLLETPGRVNKMEDDSAERTEGAPHICFSSFRASCDNGVEQAASSESSASGAKCAHEKTR
jgi:hypothetical protein